MAEAHEFGLAGWDIQPPGGALLGIPTRAAAGATGTGSLDELSAMAREAVALTNATELRTETRHLRRIVVSMLRRLWSTEAQSTLLARIVHEAAAVAVPRTGDDTPILAGTGGRRATREELIAFVAEHAARAEREARERKS